MAEVKCEQEERSSTENYDWLKEWTEPEDAKEDFKHEIKIEVECENNQKPKITQSHGPTSDSLLGKVSTRKSRDFQSSIQECVSRKDVKTRPVNEEMTIQIDQQIEKLCKGSTVSGRVSNMCLFQCLECGKSLNAWTALKEHMANICIQKLTLTDVDRYITRAICHVCKVCSVQVLCDKFMINRHLTNRHKMIITQYTDKFGYDTSKRVPEVTYSDTIGNLCVFKCVDCGETMDSRRSLGHHQKNYSHGKKFKLGEKLSKIVYHKCKLCNRRILCDTTILTIHMKSCHRLNLEEYSERAKVSIVQNQKNSTSLARSFKLCQNIKNACVFSCNICSKKHVSLLNFQRHLKTHQPDSIGSLSTCIVQGFSYQCKLCSRVMLCDRSIFREHMTKKHYSIWKGRKLIKAQYYEMREAFLEGTPTSSAVWNRSVLPINKVLIKEFTSKIGDLCTFSCPECDEKSFYTFSSILRHCKKSHDSNLSYGPSLVSVARCHACLICSKAILCDRYFIKGHLRGAHKMKISKYELIFQKHGGKTLPSYYAWLQSHPICETE